MQFKLKHKIQHVKLPNLVSLAYFGLVVNSLLITNDPPLTLSQYNSLLHSILSTQSLVSFSTLQAQWQPPKTLSLSLNWCCLNWQ